MKPQTKERSNNIMETRKVKISDQKKQALRNAIDQLGKVTFVRSIIFDSEVNSLLQNRACYINDMARIQRLQNARSEILDEYTEIFNTTDIDLTQVLYTPVTILSVELDKEAEALLKEASIIETQFLKQFFLS